jgi:hypothetical protein
MKFSNLTSSARHVGTRAFRPILNANPKALVAGAVAVACVVLGESGLAIHATNPHIYASRAQLGAYWGDCNKHNVGFEVRGDFGPFEELAEFEESARRDRKTWPRGPMVD